MSYLHQRLLDLPIVQLNGSHKPAKNGGVAVSYQRRKAACTSNDLFLTDNTGQPLPIATPQAGNHYNTFELEQVFAVLWVLLAQMGLRINCLFFNTDKALAVKVLHQAGITYDITANIACNCCSTDWQADDDSIIDPKLCRQRLVIKKMNTWLDEFKALLVRYETCSEYWVVFVVLINA